MTSPDWTDYVDLTPYDKDATEIFNEAIEYAKDVLPEWSPEAGNIEVVLLEAAATEAANVIAAANRVPGAVVEALLQLFDVTRSDGVRATGTVEVTLTTSSGAHTVPASTRFVYIPPAGGVNLVYTLDDDLIIADGSLTGSGAITAFSVGDDYNSPSAGDSLQIASTIPFVLSASFDSKPSGGSSSETDTEYFDRAMSTLRSYSSALVTDDQVQSWVLVNYPTDVYRCKVYNRRTEADRDTTDAGYTTHDGYGLVIVAGENADPADPSDVAVSADKLVDIKEDLDELIPVSAVVDVANAELVQVTIVADFVVRDGYDSVEVQEAIEDALDAYLSPNSWEWEEGVRVNSIIAVISDVAGVYYVSGTPTINSGGDLTFDLLGTLPYPGDHTISVTV